MDLNLLNLTLDKGLVIISAIWFSEEQWTRLTSPFFSASLIAWNFTIMCLVLPCWTRFFAIAITDLLSTKITVASLFCPKSDNNFQPNCLICYCWDILSFRWGLSYQFLFSWIPREHNTSKGEHNTSKGENITSKGENITRRAFGVINTPCPNTISITNELFAFILQVIQPIVNWTFDVP